MQRNVLELYLTKVSSGDKQYVEKLCQRLAERLLWVPVLTIDEVSKDGAPVQRVELVTVRIEGTPFVPIFTTEAKLTQWLSLHHPSASALSIMGRDLCKQLDPDLSLLINEGSQNMVELPPVNVSEIAKVPSLATFDEGEDEDAEFGPQTMRRAPAPTHASDDSAEKQLEALMRDPEASGKTIEIVVDLKKIQELVRKQILEQSQEVVNVQSAAPHSDLTQPRDPSTKERPVITLYDVVADDEL
ncbi:MAG: SseB family protein [Deltaproteobacteria bacterium]|nr:SseB family protein [Deltaproteobacteria bacterium]